MSVLKLLEKRNLINDENDSSDQDLNLDKDIDEKSESEEVVKEESAFKEADEKQWKNRCRVLVTTGRGSAPGFRSMVKDILDLLPHSKKEVFLNLNIL